MFTYHGSITFIFENDCSAFEKIIPTSRTVAFKVAGEVGESIIYYYYYGGS